MLDKVSKLTGTVFFKFSTCVFTMWFACLSNKMGCGLSSQNRFGKLIGFLRHHWNRTRIFSVEFLRYLWEKSEPMGIRGCQIRTMTLIWWSKHQARTMDLRPKSLMAMIIFMRLNVTGLYVSVLSIFALACSPGHRQPQRLPTSG